MIHLRRFFAKVFGLFRNTRIEEELTREIASHHRASGKGLPAPGHVRGASSPRRETNVRRRGTGETIAPGRAVNSVARTDPTECPILDSSTPQISGLYDGRGLHARVGHRRGHIRLQRGGRGPAEAVRLSRSRSTGRDSRDRGGTAHQDRGHPGQLPAVPAPEAERDNARGCGDLSTRGRQHFFIRGSSADGGNGRDFAESFSRAWCASCAGPGFCRRRCDQGL